MFFLSFINANLQFDTKKLTWKTYTTTKAIPITKQIELINKHKFAKMALDKISNTFVMYVTALETPSEITIYLSQVAQVPILQKVTQLAALQWDKVPIKISAKYAHYTDIFSLKSVIKLLKNTNINKHVIELIEDMQLSYEPIYALNLMELEILKTYTKTYLKTGFIRPYKSSAYASIFFNKKSDTIFYLCVYY